MFLGTTLEQLPAARQAAPYRPPATEQPLYYNMRPPPPQSLPVQPKPTVRSDPSSVASVIVVLCCVGILVGLLLFTTAADRAPKGKSRTAAQTGHMMPAR